MKCKSCGADVEKGRVCKYCGSIAWESLFNTKGTEGEATLVMEITPNARAEYTVPEVEAVRSDSGRVFSMPVDKMLCKVVGVRAFYVSEVTVTGKERKG